jgi:hypothetical protein
MKRRHLILATTSIASAVLAATSAMAQNKSTQKFPDVIAVKVRATSAGTFDFDVTVSSTYDTPQRYADGIRVRSKDGQVFGERKLLHDHADEQPFTRDVYNVKLPGGVRSVVVEARDQQHGWGGKTMDVAVPGR